jgi:1-acyl-sn-glycerol-3-phosphate acyltransferase
MRLSGYIYTEKSDYETILVLCRREMENKSVIVCFPEGTRSLDGKLGRFYSGAFKLAVELDRPIVPLVIKGASGVMPKGSLIFRPEKLELKMFGAVYPQSFKDEVCPHLAMKRDIVKRFVDYVGKV